MTNEELADIVLERLQEFSPAISIGLSPWDPDTVRIEILMCREPLQEKP